jgi:hypothetical protein
MLSSKHEAYRSYDVLTLLLSGTAVYSPQIKNGSSFTSAGGEPLTFTSNVSLAFMEQLMITHVLFSSPLVSS